MQKERHDLICQLRSMATDKNPDRDLMLMAACEIEHLDRAIYNAYISAKREHDASHERFGY